MGKHGKHWQLVTAAVLAGMVCAGSAQACRQALALGLDVSGSVDSAEYRLQLDGLADALNSAKVRAVLLDRPDDPVRIAVFEWSGPAAQTVIVPWTDVSDVGGLAAVDAQLRLHQRSPASPTTAIGAAMQAGFVLLGQQEACEKRTLDISGDGESNTGPRPQDIGRGDGFIVNGLTIGTADADELATYYRNYVIRGSAAFVETAQGFNDYAAAMERKLLRELRDVVVGAVTPAPVFGHR